MSTSSTFSMQTNPLKRLVYFILLVSASLAVRAQSQYPQGYFRNPLAIPMNLAGNFGELRPNHYHMGIDIKTNQRENLPVYAAAEGFVSRIKIEPGGFGRAIYITHPNGYTTLYAHLNDFVPRIEAWVKQKQYEKQSWKIQLDLQPGQFPVKKGEQIAFSGNTGGSQAPHVHFEIRRTSDDVNLNPLLFGLPLQDKVKPRILRLAIYDRTRSIYEQAPRIIPVKLTSRGYVTTPAVINLSSPLISVAVTAFDTHTGSSNKNGIFEGVLKVNNKEDETFRMDDISYNDTRYLNAHIDYRYKTLTGTYLQHFSELPGYLNSIYSNDTTRGVIDISDNDLYDIELEVSDAEGNRSRLLTHVQYEYQHPPPPPPAGKMFYPLMLDGFESETCEFYIGENCLYDSVHVNHKAFSSPNPDVISDVHAIGASYIPIHDSFMVRLQPLTLISELDKQWTVMQWFSGTRSSAQKVQWQNQWATANFRDFGNFMLVVDTIPPIITPIGFKEGADLSKSQRIMFSVKENLPVVQNVRAELDGKWLRFTNDKGKNFIYRFDEKCPPGNHELVITAEDVAGNKTRNSYRFTR